MRAVGVLAALGLTLSAAVPVQAEVAAVWALVYADPAGVEEQEPFTSASPGVTVVVVRHGAGDYQVRLGGGAAGGVPVVTAVNDHGRHCQVASFASVGRDEVVDVACYAGAVRAESAFTLSFISWTQSDSPAGGGAYGYVSSDGAAAYNSAGGEVRVQWQDEGVWKVRFGDGVFANAAGNAQVTGVGTQPVRCGVIDWAEVDAEDEDGAGVEVAVRCAGDSPQWTLVYAHERSILNATTGLFGYLQANRPSEGEYEPDIRRNYGPNGHAHTITHPSTGRYLVNVHGPLKLPVLIHVSAGDDSDTSCVLAGWEAVPAQGPDDPTGLVEVLCHDAEGEPADSWFTLNYYSTRP